MDESRMTSAVAQDDEATDRELIDQARSGQWDAQDTLARRHRQGAFVLALQMLGNRDDAMAVAQDAMLRFFTTLDSFNRDRRVQPWLFTIVRNQVRDLWRRRQRRPGDGLVDGEALAGQLVDSANPEADLQRQQLRKSVWRAVATLSETKREIIVLRDFHDLSYKDISDVLKIPIGTVMSRLHGARKQLKAKLEEGGPHV